MNPGRSISLRSAAASLRAGTAAWCCTRRSHVAIARWQMRQMRQELITLTLCRAYTNVRPAQGGSDERRRAVSDVREREQLVGGERGVWRGMAFGMMAFWMERRAGGHVLPTYLCAAGLQGESGRRVWQSLAAQASLAWAKGFGGDFRDVPIPMCGRSASALRLTCMHGLLEVYSTYGEGTAAQRRPGLGSAGV
jgi:hypothetical protein